MDAIKFIKERDRMCKSYYRPAEGSCGDCPAKYVTCDELSVMAEDEPDTIVKIVEEWSAAHPCKTRQSVFLEQWPEADIDENGVVAIAPCSLLEIYRKGELVAGKCGALEKECDDCRREFWMQEVE